MATGQYIPKSVDKEIKQIMNSKGIPKSEAYRELLNYAKIGKQIDNMVMGNKKKRKYYKIDDWGF